MFNDLSSSQAHRAAKAVRQEDDPTNHCRMLIVGSINQDSYLYVDAIPAPGQTVFAKPGLRGLGGKGANQAVAASLMGADVLLAGNIGADQAGDEARSLLIGYGVDCDLLEVEPLAETGSAIVCVDPAGENAILVTRGANATVKLPHCLPPRTMSTISLASTKVVLTQGELNPEVVNAVADQCQSFGKRLVINLAPAITLGSKTLEQADPLILNQGEAAELLASIGNDLTIRGIDSARVAASYLVANVARSVVITLGHAGAVVADSRSVWHQPSPQPAAVVDTTGAGDAFTGALAAALARGESLEHAVRTGVVAGSLTVGRIGTTSSYPIRQEVDDALSRPGSATVLSKME